MNSLVGRLVAIGLVLLLVVVVPTLSVYQIELVTQMLIYAIFAMSLDILLGYTGLPSLGHAAYFGLAAYATTILSLRLHVPFALAAPAGIAASVVAAALFNLLALRTSRGYYLMITLALSQLLWSLAVSWTELTGGDNGLPGLKRPSLPWFPSLLASAGGFFYLTLFVFLVSTIALWVLVRSPVGYALKGVRENEARMRALGYAVWHYKYFASIVAAFFAGVAGELFVYLNGFVSPSALSVTVSAQVLIMVLVGAAGTLFGPMLGAVLFVLLQYVVSSYTERWLFVIGIMYLVIALYAPLVVNNLSHSFGGVRALDGISLQLQAGERRAIIGTNGAGKTTLFNVINGQIAPCAGEIRILGTNATRLPVHRRAALGLARTFQVTSLFPHLSVLHNMIVAVAALSRFHFVFWRSVTAHAEIVARAQDMLAGWNLWDYRDELVANLSYGVQRQLEIVLALAGNPKLLLLDEPMAGLSASETHLASDIILNLDRAITVLLIEHDLAAAFRIADRVTAMDQGRIVAEGTPDEIRKESSLKRIYMGAGAVAPKNGAAHG